MLGKPIFAERCASCHGDKGEDPKYRLLAGGPRPLTADQLRESVDPLLGGEPVLTIGSYWQYATTLWGYIRRSQPFDEPGSLTADQVYAVTAYLLHVNGIIGEQDVLDARTLPKIRMPNRDGFVPDARPDVGKAAKARNALAREGADDERPGTLWDGKGTARDGGVAMTGLVVAAAWAVLVTAPAWAGTIKGHVRFTGPATERRPCPSPPISTCAGRRRTPRIWSSRRTRAFAIPSCGSHPCHPGRSGSRLRHRFLDQTQCAFTPRVVVVPVGGTVEFLNNDRLLHNLHSQSTGNPTFNRTQPKGRAIPITFTKPEIIRIDCDLHPWMRAWVVVAEHPFYAVTGASGEFALRNLPAGQYTLNVWQETLGTVTKDVTAGEADTAVVIEMGRR